MRFLLIVIIYLSIQVSKFFNPKLLYLKEGDMLVSKSKTHHVNKWSDGIIPYKFDENSAFTDKEKQIIVSTMARIMEQTGNCIRFVTRKEEKAYISFNTFGRDCYSGLGKLPDYNQPQQISLARPNCINHGTIAHELMHALGFLHEHTRSDRDNYINIQWKNIIPHRLKWFRIASNDDDELILSLPYDTQSILHYRWNAFSIDKEMPTIIPKDPNIDYKIIGSSLKLSELDVQKLKKMYGCYK